jgi:hypothetical protein
MVRTLPIRTVLVAVAVLASAVIAVGYAQRSRAQTDASVDIRRVVKTYETALMTGDGKTACAQLTSSARGELIDSARHVGAEPSCQGAATLMKRYIDYLASQAPTPARAADARRMIEDPPVRVTRVDGDSATARIVGVSGHPIPLTRTGGGWKISGLSFPSRSARDIPPG